MTKYRWITEVDNARYVKHAINNAAKYPYCLQPLQIIQWNLEELKRYDKRIKEYRRRVGSYLK